MSMNSNECIYLFLMRRLRDTYTRLGLGKPLGHIIRMSDKEYNEWYSRVVLGRT